MDVSDGDAMIEETEEDILGFVNEGQTLLASLQDSAGPRAKRRKDEISEIDNYPSPMEAYVPLRLLQAPAAEQPHLSSLQHAAAGAFVGPIQEGEDDDL